MATFHCGEIRPRPVHCSLIQTSRSCHGQWVDICTFLMCFSRAWQDRETWKIHQNVSKLLKKTLKQFPSKHNLIAGERDPQPSLHCLCLNLTAITVFQSFFRPLFEPYRISPTIMLPALFSIQRNSSWACLLPEFGEGRAYKGMDEILFNLRHPPSSHFT